MKHTIKSLMLTVLFLATASAAFSQTAQDYVSSGLDKFNNDDYGGAIADYNKAIKLNPDYVTAYYARGQAEFMKEDWNAVIADFTKVIELKPDDYAYSMRGNARKNTGDSDGAIADYNKAIELKPDNADYYSWRGNAKKAKGDLQGALVDYNKSLELNPGDADIQKEINEVNASIAAAASAIGNTNVAPAPVTTKAP